MSHRFNESHVDVPAWVAESLLVRRWQAMKREVLDHKWYESERAGHDIGWDRAYVGWSIRHAPAFEDRFAQEA